MNPPNERYELRPKEPITPDSIMLELAVSNWRSFEREEGFLKGLDHYQEEALHLLGGPRGQEMLEHPYNAYQFSWHLTYGEIRNFWAAFLFGFDLLSATMEEREKAIKQVELGTYQDDILEWVQARFWNTLDALRSTQNQTLFKVPRR